MKKKQKIFILIITIIGLSIVIFNNIHSIIATMFTDYRWIYAYGFILIAFTFYIFWNKKYFKKLY